MSIDRSLVLVHGRDFKPEHDTYLDISMTALRSGIERDYPDRLEEFDALRKALAWYGDLNADVLQASGRHYDEMLDVGDRQNALTEMRAISARKKFGIRQYDRLPGKTSIPEFVANFTAPVLGSVGLSVPLIGTVAKDVGRYFDRKSDFAARVRERLRERLCEQLDRGDPVALLSHGTGSVVAYDVLWQLSHDPEFTGDYGDKKIDLWITMGAPLGDSSIRKRLLGARRKSIERYPTNVISWHNVSAEDDYTCHDNTLADDFAAMMKQRIVSVVHDYKIFNLAVRYGKSNPHSSVGYYIHPRVAKILADWLTDHSAQPTTGNPA